MTDEMTLFQMMVDKDPRRNPVFTAIETLSKPIEIRTFVKEYEQWMLKNGGSEIKGIEIQTARENIGYILGYYDRPVQEKWYGLLPQVSHPIFGSSFGRGKDVTDAEAYRLGVLMGERIKHKSNGGKIVYND